MLQNKIYDLSNFSNKIDLDLHQKKKRKEITLEIVSIFKSCLFDFFYEDFFSFSTWNHGYQDNKINIYVRNNRYSSFIKFSLDYSTETLMIEFISPKSLKLFGVYPMPIPTSAFKNVYSDDQISKIINTSIDFQKINEDVIVDFVEKYFENFLLNESVVQENLNNLTEKEIFLFDDQLKMRIDLKEFLELFEMNYNYEREFIRHETLLLLNEASKTVDKKRKKILLHTACHLNFKLLSRFIFLFKKEDLSNSELIFVITELYSGLFRAAEKYKTDSRATFSTYANYWILNKVNRSQFEIVRKRSIKKFNLTPSYQFVFDTFQHFKNTTGAYPSTDDLSNLVLLEAEKLYKEKKIVEKKKLKEQFDNSGLIKFVENISKIKIKNNEVSTYQIHIQRLVILVLDKREAQIINKRYNLKKDFQSDKKLSLQVIADEFDLTRERIRQIELVCIRKLEKAYKKFPVGIDPDKNYLRLLVDDDSYKKQGKFVKYQNINKQLGSRGKILIDYIYKHSLDFYGELEEIVEPRLKILVENLRNNKTNINNNNIDAGQDLIEFLDLSNRSYNALIKEGIDLISQIKLDELEYITNLGSKSIDEIITKVSNYKNNLNS